jgi:hypothetical protein
VGLDLAEPGVGRIAAAGPPPEVRPPSPGQVAALLEWARRRDPPLFCYLRLAVSTGARRSQLLALRWGDVDVERAAIAFTRALVEGPDGPELRSTKTHRTYRVELDAETLHVLMAHRARARARDVGAELTAGAFVFSSRPDGAKPWLPNWLTKRFIAARRAAGLPHFRLHDLRHFMTTEMLAAGVPIATVSQRLSHARASTTLNVYAHSVPGGDREAAETLALILAASRGAGDSCDAQRSEGGQVPQSAADPDSSQERGEENEGRAGSAGIEERFDHRSERPTLSDAVYDEIADALVAEAERMASSGSSQASETSFIAPKRTHRGRMRRSVHARKGGVGARENRRGRNRRLPRPFRREASGKGAAARPLVRCPGK